MRITLISFAPARPKDADVLVSLMDELEQFYGSDALNPTDEQAQRVRAALFGERPAAYALIAWEEGKAVGFASYSFLWPAVGFTRSLHLKELYVSRGYRRAGVGKLFMDELRKIARRENCSRVEWTTDAPNENARRFYASLGFVENSSKIFYRSTL
jgi:GNAT superfamily N-acetyltransferase